MDRIYTEINDIPFIIQGYDVTARLVPSDDRTQLIERKLTSGELSWYADRAEENAGVISRERAEELAWKLSYFKLGRFESSKGPFTRCKADKYGIYAIFDKNTERFTVSFKTTSKFYAKTYYLENYYGHEERYKLYHIGDVDDSGYFSTYMDYVTIDCWDRHDFGDCRMTKEELGAVIEDCEYDIKN